MTLRMFPPRRPFQSHKPKASFYVQPTVMLTKERPLLSSERTPRKDKEYAGFEVLTPVVMMISIFWDTRAYSPLKANRRLGGTCRLHLQGWRVSQVRNQHEADNKIHSTKRRLAFNGLHALTLQNSECLKTKIDSEPQTGLDAKTDHQP
jgi:hypothetical protein